MDSLTFKSRLQTAGLLAVELAKNHATNNFSENLAYIIQPNKSQPDIHLNDFEISLLNQMVKEQDKILGIDAVVERLCVNSTTPKWISISVYKANKNNTIIQLLASRRFREEDKLYHRNEGFPPFHVIIQIPPFITENNDTVKFDINWRHRKFYYWIKMSLAKLNNVTSMNFLVHV